MAHYTCHYETSFQKERVPQMVDVNMTWLIIDVWAGLVVGIGLGWAGLGCVSTLRHYSSLSELEAPPPQALSLTVFTFNLEYAISQGFCPFFLSELEAPHSQALRFSTAFLIARQAFIHVFKSELQLLEGYFLFPADLL
ncbi:hypothetical protein TorRG33x02_289850 [Trema orientale]|uniref:Uncharacterized protein n=1 Tax=Trema orientale TaxID=63057 RepID=A0A2P5CCN2_TREOI|nr:hypothetical protein TorRG33x02_289850 [Trema orientale]